MFKIFNIFLITGLSFFYSPSHSKEIFKDQKYLSSRVEEIAEEINNLNISLDLLSVTISKILPASHIESNF